MYCPSVRSYATSARCPIEQSPHGATATGSPRTPLGGRTTLLVDRVGGTEVRVEDFAIANDVPLGQDWEAALGEPRRLDIELFVGFEMVTEFSQ